MNEVSHRYGPFQNPVFIARALAALGHSDFQIDAQGFVSAAEGTTPESSHQHSLADCIEIVTRPEALLFDMDDTLADATESYRRATILTAKYFGVDASLEDVTAAKAAGNANDDWELTWGIITRGGGSTTVETVKRIFEDFYQGTDEDEGLKHSERLLVDRNWLRDLSHNYALGVVTGRPRSDAQFFLRHTQIEDLFGTVVTFDDGPLKPDPHPVRLALQAMLVKHAWLIGDTPDDVRAARAAGVLPIGVIAPGDDPEVARQALTDAGAAAVLDRTSDLTNLLYWPRPG